MIRTEHQALPYESAVWSRLAAFAAGCGEPPAPFTRPAGVARGRGWKVLARKQPDAPSQQMIGSPFLSRVASAATGGGA
jgi:hypothetical protein